MSNSLFAFWRSLTATPTATATTTDTSSSFTRQKGNEGEEKVFAVKVAEELVLHGDCSPNAVEDPAVKEILDVTKESVKRIADVAKESMKEENYDLQTTEEVCVTSTEESAVEVYISKVIEGYSPEELEEYNQDAETYLTKSDIIEDLEYKQEQTLAAYKDKEMECESLEKYLEEAYETIASQEKELEFLYRYILDNGELLEKSTRSLQQNCKNCLSTFEINADGACRFHTGKMEPIAYRKAYRSAVQSRANSIKNIDNVAPKKDWPWSCCGLTGPYAPGCRFGRHVPVYDESAIETSMLLSKIASSVRETFESDQRVNQTRWEEQLQNAGV